MLIHTSLMSYTDCTRPNDNCGSGVQTLSMEILAVTVIDKGIHIK